MLHYLALHCAAFTAEIAAFRNKGRDMSDISRLYADLSHYYDQFCNDVDYAQQCDFAARAFSCFAHSTGQDYLDLACGTGPHLALMQQRGFVVSGLDNSQQMLDLAAQRCPQASLLLCDLAAFEFTDGFDVVSCFLYSLHYSHPMSAFNESIQRAYRALKPGGIFIFDCVDKRGVHHNSLRNSGGVVTHVATDDGELRFQSGWKYRGTGNVLDLELSIEHATDAGTQRWQDHHTMTAVTIEQVKTMLEQAGFEVTLLEHDYSTMRQWSGDSFNVIVAAVKPQV